MNAVSILKVTSGYMWRLPLCALAYTGGAMAGGALLTALALPLPEVPEQADPRIMSLLLPVASLALAAGLAPLARRLAGPFWTRWLTLALLCYVCLGVAAPLEGAIFTHLGGMAALPLFSILPCLLFGAVVASLFRPADRGDAPTLDVRGFFRGRTVGNWAWRFVAALCAFPVVYWTFGLMVAPFVMEYYKQGQFALTVPQPAVILLMQFTRGTLFLAAALPILMMWSGSRRQLVLALGLAFYVLVGLFGMMQSYWLAPTLQVLHNTEMLADSLVYALALAVLLVRPGETKADELFTRFLLCLEQTPVGN
jgi:hypothetical protein